MPGRVLKELVPFQEYLGHWTFLFPHGVPNGTPERGHFGQFPLADGAGHTGDTQLLGQSESHRFGAGGHFVTKIHGCYQNLTM